MRKQVTFEISATVLDEWVAQDRGIGSRGIKGRPPSVQMRTNEEVKSTLARLLGQNGLDASQLVADAYVNYPGGTATLHVTLRGESADIEKAYQLVAGM